MLLFSGTAYVSRRRNKIIHLLSPQADKPITGLKIMWLLMCFLHLHVALVVGHSSSLIANIHYMFWPEWQSSGVEVGLKGNCCGCFLGGTLLWPTYRIVGHIFILSEW
jgi:hypothetical protein